MSNIFHISLTPKYTKYILLNIQKKILNSLGPPWWLRRLRICLQCRRPGFNSWIGMILWRREWQPTPVFLSGQFHGQRNLVGYSPWDCKQSDTTEGLTLNFPGGNYSRENSCEYIRFGTFKKLKQFYASIETIF